MQRKSPARRNVSSIRIASVRKTSPKKPAPRQRAYICHKYEERYLKNYLKGQLRNRQIDVSVSDWSLKEGVPDSKWKNKAREKIRRCDKVVVVLGKRTYMSDGVRKEIGMARKMGKPVCQIKPKSSRGSKPVSGAGRQYMWTHSNLQKIFGE